MTPQQNAHLDELGEHERLFADVDELVDQLVEAGQLAGSPMQAGPVAECVGRVVADLFELREGGEDDRPPLHPFVLVGLFEQLVDDLLVEHGLLAGEPGPGDLFDLVGQFGHELAIGLGAPHERAGQCLQRGSGLFGHDPVVATLDRLGVAVAELLAEPSMPGLTQSRIAHSSDKRFSTGVPVKAMRWPACSLRTACRSRGRILDELRFVEDDRRPGDVGEDVEVAAEQAIGRDDEIAGRQHARRSPSPPPWPFVVAP